MKKLFLLMAVLLCSLPAWAGATFTYCNSASSGSGGTTSQTCSLSVTAGQNWFYAITWPSSVATATLTSANGHLSAFTTYTNTTFTDGSITRTVQIGCVHANTTGTESIVATYNANSTFAQLEGALQTDVNFTSCATALNNAGAGAGIGSANGSGTGTFTITSSAATSTIANVSVLGACDGNTGSTNYGPGTGFTAWVGIPVPQLVGEDKVGVAAGSQTATCNFTATANWGIVMALVCDGDCATSPASGYFHHRPGVF
jgi:hypothetical protein